MLKPRRNGATIVMVAVILPVLLVLVGFAVDLAYMQQVRTELSTATDLASKAASVTLADTGSTADAIARGKLVAARNHVGGRPLALADTDFVFGNSVRNDGSRWAFVPGGNPTNAVRITGHRTSSSADGEVPLFFSGFLNGKSFAPTATATASFVDVDICLVLDRSNSMKLALDSTAAYVPSGDPRYCDVPWADSRWVALDSAVDVFLTQLGVSSANEQVALVTFSSDYTSCGGTTSVATIDQSLTTNLSLIASAMSARSNSVWNGRTEIDDGIAMGRTVLNGAGVRPFSIKVMILLTDGEYTGEDPVPEAVGADAEEIHIHTVTFGAGANQADMKNVAAAASGGHYHAPDKATLEEVFRKVAGAITVLTE